jgi:uncharacterized repeat protein (TIGR01451 family)
LSLLANRCTGGNITNALSAATAADGTNLAPSIVPVVVPVLGDASLCTSPTVHKARVSETGSEGRAHWTITVTNTQANSAAQNGLEITDADTRLDGSTGGACATTAPGMYRCNVPANDSVALHVSAPLPALGTYDVCTGTSIDNHPITATTAGGTTLSGVTYGDTKVSIVAVANVSCLSITKTGAANGAANDYTITITNTGPETTAVVSDTYIAAGTGSSLTGSVGKSGVSGTCDMAALQGSGCTLSVPTGGGTITVSSSPVTNVTCGPVTISNTATARWLTASGSPVGPGAGGNAVSRIYPGVTCAPGLAIQKTGPGSAALGADVVYQVTVANSGNATTSGPITVTDDAPAGLTGMSAGGDGWSCAVGATNGVECTTDSAIGAGDSAPMITINGKAPGASCETLHNVAAVTGGGDAGVHSSSPAVETAVTGCGPRLTIDKHPSVSEVDGGTSFQYTIVVGNSGTAEATDVRVSDNFSGNGVGTMVAVGGTCSVLPCDIATIGAGESVTITVSIATTASVCGTVDNAATASITGGTVSVTDETDNEVTVGNCTAHLTLRKVLDTTNGDSSPPTDRSAFTPMVDGSASSWDAATEVATGMHVLGESSVEGWTNGTGWVCPGAQVSDGNRVTLTAGQDVTCTITNASQKAHIVVNKAYVLHGSVKVAPVIKVGGVNLGVAASGDGTHDSWGPVDVKAGAVVIDETVSSGDWSQTGAVAAGDCGTPGAAGTSVTVQVAPGRTCTVTFTNERRTGSVSVHTQKTLAASADNTQFSGTINGASPWGPIGIGGSATVTSVPSGAATVEEIAASGGWFRSGLLSLYAGSCPTDPAAYSRATVNVVASQLAEVCILNDKAAEQVKRTLIVGEVIVSANPDATASFAGTVSPGGLTWTLAHGAVTTFRNLDSGAYTVGEAAKAGYATLGFRVFYDGRESCPGANGSYDSAGSLVADLTTPAHAAALVCVYNQPQGSVTLTMRLVPASDPARFDLRIDGAAIGAGTNVGDGGITGKTTVAGGVHTVSEAAHAGTDPDQYSAAIECGAGIGATFVVAPGQDVICAITNTRRPSVTPFIPPVILATPVSQAPIVTPTPAPTRPPVPESTATPAPNPRELVDRVLGEQAQPAASRTPGVAPLPPNTGTGTSGPGGSLDGCVLVAGVLSITGGAAAVWLGRRPRIKAA